MRRRTCFTLAFVPVLGIGLMLLSGCGGSDTPSAPKSGGGGGAGPAPKPSGGGTSKDLKVVAYGPSLKGKVTFSGSDNEMEPKKLAPTKDQDKCPKEVPAEGWYANKANKGIQYAVVFLRAPKGFKMPKAAPELDKASSPELEMKQPHCQFEPRVLVLHPKQNLKIVNDSQPTGINHDGNVSGLRNNPAPKTIAPGSFITHDLRADNTEPNKVSCGQHAGTMSAYVWKMDHPYAVVTNESGEYELKHVPVLDGEKMVLWVWHEMLPAPTRMKEIGPIEVEKDKAAEKNFALPN